ncbi:MAG TPA: aminoacyl-tRNA hydrolase [Candidatus Paceibacterota bacterium]|jgi:PTH1 family peptidyl-tRNA hydrolase|nr:aminoacyl-tRNA hydrolase [Candidatus Paceibacterota bacterium]
MVKVIVGLGNPGEEYANTYHNVGVQALRAIGEELAAQGLPAFKTHRHLFEYSSVGDFALVIPLTFMNASGEAVKEALKKFNAEPRDLIVLHDESDLTVGNYKISKDRGAAGHKGVQSIMDVLGCNDFTRVRIGIRPAQEIKRKKAEEFVLSAIKPGDKTELRKVFTEVKEALTR